MGLLDFKKKKTAPCCGEGKKPNNTACSCAGKQGEGKYKTNRFIVLGACCKKSADTFTNVKQAVLEMGFSDTVVNIGDAVEIAGYGVMQTPAFVINGKVVSYGKLIKVDEAKKLIEISVVSQ